MQKIRILQPIGWCEGVKQAINNLNKIIKKHKNNIYLIGQLIHNKETMNYYIKKDIKILDGVDRLKLIKSIKNKDATIVFSAHGTSQNIIDYANQHFKHVYDLTCKYVKANYLLVNKLKSQGHSVTYYGNKNHPESIAMKSLGISFKPSKTSILINQTTIPLIKVKKIQQKYKCKWIPTTCLATKKIHQNILKLPIHSQLLVIGDKNSNNTKELIGLAKQHQLKVNCKFDESKVLYITSGTSVSKKQVHEAIKSL